MVPALNSPEILVCNAEAREPAPAEPGEAVPRPWAPCTLWIRGFHLSLPLLRGTPARAGGTESKSILIRNREDRRKVRPFHRPHPPLAPIYPGHRPLSPHDRDRPIPHRWGP
jgi:hypothetical protein